MEIEEYKETATIDQNGKVLSVECDGVSSPAGYGFDQVNDWVHSLGRHYEELKWHALGAANQHDKLVAEIRNLNDRIVIDSDLLQCLIENSQELKELKGYMAGSYRGDKILNALQQEIDAAQNILTDAATVF